MLDTRQILVVTLLSAVTLPLTAQPLRGGAGRQQNPGGSPTATELLNARRALRLTPRQVTRLDSIERVQFAEREQMRQSLRAQRDSLCGGTGPCRLSPEQREQARARFQSALPQRQAGWRRDSLGRASAWALLDSTQRGQVQGMRMARQARLAQARGNRFAQQGRRGGPSQGPGARFMDPQGRRDGQMWGPRGRGNQRPNWRENAGPGWRLGPPGPMGGQQPGAGMRGRRGRPGDELEQRRDSTPPVR